MSALVYVLLLLICIALLAVAWQDFKTRSVYTFLFAFLFVTGCLLQYLRCGYTQESYIHIALNISVVCIQLVTIYLYLKIVKGIKFFEGIGLGDVFFYICIIPILSFPVFIIYNISSLVFALLLYLVGGKRIQMHSEAIPLAGIQALTLFVTIVVLEFVFSIPVLGTCFLLSI